MMLGEHARVPVFAYHRRRHQREAADQLRAVEEELELDDADRRLAPEPVDQPARRDARRARSPGGRRGASPPPPAGRHFGAAASVAWPWTSR